MSRKSKIAVVVSLALSSGAALAANPIWQTSVVIAGSSLMRDAVAKEMQVICATGTYQLWVAAQGFDSGITPDFQAHTCTLGSNLGGQLANLPVIVYYRSEGGSIFSILGQAILNNGTSQPINRLNLGPSGATTCTSNGVVLGVTEVIPGDILADSMTGCVVKDTVQLGISDVEPAAYVGENWGSEYTFIPYPQPTVTTLNRLDRGPFMGQVFAPIVASRGNATSLFAGPGVSTHGLTSQELVTIFTGNVNDWGSVPSAAALGAATGNPITLCRFAPGDGTQAVASRHFLGTSCSSGGLPFDTPNSGSGNTVINEFNIRDELICVGDHLNSIGIVPVQTETNLVNALVTQVTVDGTLGTAITSAQDQYPFYAEGYFIRNDAALPSGSPQLALVNKLITDLQGANNAPSTGSAPNLVALPRYNPPFSPVTPLKAGQQIPIAVGTTNGNTCTPAVNAL